VKKVGLLRELSTRYITRNRRARLKIRIIHFFSFIKLNIDFEEICKRLEDMTGKNLHLIPRFE